MVVRYLSEKALDALKAATEDFVPLFGEETNAALVAALRARSGEDELLRETPYVFPDAPLLESKASEDELANVRAVYSAMKDVPNAVAMDERLWAGLAIDRCWSYIRNRWVIAELLVKGDESTVNKIREHVLFAHNARRSFTRNAISRLWWLGNLTYDEKLEDPFGRTRIIVQDLSYIIDLLERNFSNNRRISAEFIDAVESARGEVAAKGAVILRPELRVLCKYLNMLGGVYVLDALPDGMIYRKIREKALEIARTKGSPEPVVEDEEDDENV